LTINGELIFNKITDCGEALLAIQDLLTSIVLFDYVYRRNVPTAQYTINKSLFLCDGPHVASLEIRLQIKLTLLDPLVHRLDIGIACCVLHIVRALCSVLGEQCHCLRLIHLMKWRGPGACSVRMADTLRVC
jgi:hypothetical protein